MGILEVPKGKLQVPGFGKALDQLMGEQAMLSIDEIDAIDKTLTTRLKESCEEMGLNVHIDRIKHAVSTLIKSHQVNNLAKKALEDIQQNEQELPKERIEKILKELEGFRYGIKGRLPPDY